MTADKHTAPRTRRQAGSDVKHRISRVVTRTGDGGDTGLADGSRVRKTHPRIVALGSIDELNSQLGLLIAHLAGDDELTDDIAWQQQRLFDVGAGLAVPGNPRPLDAFVSELDLRLQRINATLPPLTEFVLPGGSMAAGQAHVARAVCRRAERDMISLSDTAPTEVHASWLQFLNRSSDYLFVAARTLARRAGGEVLWRPAPAPS